MYTGKTLFAQIMDFLPWKTFHRLVSRYDGDHRIRTLPCAEHFRALAFAQLTYRESLRDIEACLSVTLFEKIPLNKDLFNTNHILEDDMNSNQLNLFNN